MTMDDVQEVEATPIEDELSVLPEADRWLSDATTKAASIASEYKPHPIRDGSDYKMSKQARTMARGEIAKLDAERKSMTKTIEDAIRDFRTRANVAMEPLRGIDSEYKQYLDEWDQMLLEQKRSDILEAYEELAPGMVDLLTPDRLWDTFAKPRKWVNKGTNVEAAKQDMTKVVEGISNGYQSLDAVQCSSEEERDQLRADYFETLDVGTALRNHREREERLDAVRAHEQAQREWEKEQGQSTEERRQRNDGARQSHEANASNGHSAENNRIGADRQGIAEEKRGEEAKCAASERRTDEALSAGIAEHGSEPVGVWEVTVPMGKQTRFREAMMAIGGIHGRRLRVEQ